MSANALGSWNFTGPQGRRLFALCAGAGVGGFWIMNMMIDKTEKKGMAGRMGNQFVPQEAIPSMQTRGLTDIDGRPVAARHDLHTGPGSRAGASHSGSWGMGQTVLDSDLRRMNELKDTEFAEFMMDDGFFT